MRSGWKSRQRTPGRAWIRVPVGVICRLLKFGVVLILPCSASADLPPGFTIEKTGAGEYLKAAGKFVYWNNGDVAAGKPNCIEECLESWIPLAAPPGAEKTSECSIVGGPDGKPQWTCRGRPLYTFVKDTFPGARLGDGRRRIWHLMFEPVDVPAGMKIESTVLGMVLADHGGRTLYENTQVADTATPDESAAVGHWRIFVAPWLAVGSRDWTIQANSDGMRQWAYKGQGLFTYAKDTDPRDIRGHGVDGAWSAVVLEAASALPSWVTIQRVDMGLAYANERGMTLYAPVDMQQILTAKTCPADCMREYWRPILASPHESSIGHWVIVENETGQRQWSYEERLLYTHTRDKNPGEMTGHGYAVGYSIGDGWRVILVDSGLRPSPS